jgi:hypothetical protein
MRDMPFIGYVPEIVKISRLPSRAVGDGKSFFYDDFRE